MNPCKRECWDCGNIADHEDRVTPYVNCKKCGSQDTRLVKDKTIEPEQSFDQVLLRKNLPPLPDGWSGPWYSCGSYVFGRLNGHSHMYVLMNYGKDAKHLVDLLNITHPAP